MHRADLAYLSNADARLPCTGLALDPDNHICYYAGVVGSRTLCKGLWASMHKSRKNNAVLTCTRWSPTAQFRGDIAGGMETLLHPLPDTQVVHTLFVAKSPGVMLLVDPTASLCTDPDDDERRPLARAAIARDRTALMQRFVGFLNAKTDVPVLPHFGETLWIAAQDNPNAIQELSAYGDCLGAWLVKEEFNWLALVKRLMLDGYLTPDPH